MVNEKIVFNSGKSNIILDIVITKEKINGETFFVAQGIQLDVASQGLSLDEALANIKDAAEMILESSKEKKLMIMEEEKQDSAPMMTRIFL